MEVLLGLIIGAIITVGIITYIKYIQSKHLTKSQSLLLLDKIKKVCKFITDYIFVVTKQLEFKKTA